MTYPANDNSAPSDPLAFDWRSCFSLTPDDLAIARVNPVLERTRAAMPATRAAIAKREAGRG